MLINLQLNFQTSARKKQSLHKRKKIRIGPAIEVIYMHLFLVHVLNSW